MAKEPRELKWIEELLPDEHCRRRPMFGGFAYYLDDKLILVTFESPGDTHYRGRTYPFDIWNGCMFPVEREHHHRALKLFPFLVPHPVLPKWLYLPLKSENFEELVTDVIRQALRPNSFWGSFPKPKKKAPPEFVDNGLHDNIDLRKPRMFSDEPARKKRKARKK